MTVKNWTSKFSFLSSCKTAITLASLLITSSAFCAPQTYLVDNKIPLFFSQSLSTFPVGWTQAPVSIYSVPLPSEKITSTTKTIQATARSLPRRFLLNNLSQAYVFSQMGFSGAAVGGSTNEQDTIYLVNGDGPGFTPEFLRETFYHELSHIIYKKYSQYFDKGWWIDANPKTFSYGGGGIIAIKEDHSSITNLNDWPLGFIGDYSMSDIREDFAVISQLMLSKSTMLYRATQVSPAIKRKVRIVMNVFVKLDPTFSTYLHMYHSVYNGK